MRVYSHLVHSLEQIALAKNTTSKFPNNTQKNSAPSVKCMNAMNVSVYKYD